IPRRQPLAADTGAAHPLPQSPASGVASRHRAICVSSWLELHLKAATEGQIDGRRCFHRREFAPRPACRATEQRGVAPAPDVSWCPHRSHPARSPPAAPMNVRAAPSVGAPGYRLIRWLAASGAASLYVASDRSSGRAAAIKIFHHVDGRALQRLERRLQANAELSHPCIVPVHEIGRTTDRRLYHSMPLLVGFEQARHDLLGRPLRIAALLRGLLEGLAYAHRSGTVHGGIKPSNVLFDKQGYAQLADFGIACSMAEPGQPSPDRGRYLSPEQAEGKAPDPRSDLYSVGILAYELLAGPSPVGGRAGQAVPRLPPRAAAWQPWMNRALAVSPELRFQTAEEMAGALRGVIGTRGFDGDDPATESTPPRRAPKWSYAAILVAVIVMLIGWGISGHRRAPVIAAATPAATASV